MTCSPTASLLHKGRLIEKPITISSTVISTSSIRKNSHNISVLDPSSPSDYRTFLLRVLVLRDLLENGEQCVDQIVTRALVRAQIAQRLHIIIVFPLLKLSNFCTKR